MTVGEAVAAALRISTRFPVNHSLTATFTRN
jgi:hypothetical protein